MVFLITCNEVYHTPDFPMGGTWYCLFPWLVLQVNNEIREVITILYLDTVKTHRVAPQWGHWISYFGATMTECLIQQPEGRKLLFFSSQSGLQSILMGKAQQSGFVLVACSRVELFPHGGPGSREWAEPGPGLWLPPTHLLKTSQPPNSQGTSIQNMIQRGDISDSNHSKLIAKSFFRRRNKVIFLVP